jgi:arabinofuranan 3-O-arabinosyltransferase
LIGLSLVSIERRPWLSGAFLGLLTFKPQFGVLFPLALLASRNWRSLAGATAASMALGVAAAVAFGYQGWLSFIHALVDRGPSLSPDPSIPLWLVSIYGFVQSMGVSARIAWAVHLAVAVPIAAAVCAVWAKPMPYSLKAAALCIAAVTVTPFVHGHDFLVLSIAVAFLVKDGLSRGFLRGERAVLLASWLGLFLLASPVSSGWIICLVLLALVVRRVSVWRTEAQDPFLVMAP